MKPVEKTPPQPPLAGPAQQTAAAIQAWPAVSAATHWELFNRTRADGVEFSAHGTGLGHIHPNGEAHLPTPHGLGVALLERGLARPFPYGGGYGSWVSFHIRTAADADHATWLFRLAYDQLLGTPLAALTERLPAGRGQ